MPPKSSTLSDAKAKREAILQFIRSAISREEAVGRGMVPLSRVTAIRNWTCRESLYDFAQQNKQASPTLVIVGVGRAALYSVPASRRKA